MNALQTYKCAGDGMCIDPRCPTHSHPEMRALCARLTAPPSIALAIMAVHLAESRHGGRLGPMGIVPRWKCETGPGVWPVSQGFYRIIDRITRGEKP